MPPIARRAVFLDRDGVLIEEDGYLVDAAAMRLLPGLAAALGRLDRAGFELAVVTNQPIVARGLVTEEDVDGLHGRLAALVVREGGPELRHFYVCPHHPRGDVARYRIECDCRKPRPGLLLRAASELDVELAHSFMVGDRISDVAAGARAGCATVLVRTGAHLERPIESPDPPEPGLQADHECENLPEAADWILGTAA